MSKSKEIRLLNTPFGIACLLSAGVLNKETWL